MWHKSLLLGYIHSNQISYSYSNLKAVIFRSGPYFTFWIDAFINAERLLVVLCWSASIHQLGSSVTRLWITCNLNQENGILVFTSESHSTFFFYMFAYNEGHKLLSSLYLSLMMLFIPSASFYSHCSRRSRSTSVPWNMKMSNPWFQRTESMQKLWNAEARW